MRVGMPLSYSADGFTQTARELIDYEQVGLDAVYLPEVYTFDSVSQLGYLAATTSTVTIGASILNIYSRTPSLLGMTAAGLDAVSEGRFSLGLGASGPQVVEGWHGVAYDAPLARTREVIDICRTIWRRERLEHYGRHYHLPLTEEHGGSGLGKPLKLINHPVRPDIPVVLAALGPKNVALAAELCEGWEPIFFYPEHAQETFGASLAEGTAKREASLGPLDILVDTSVCLTDSAEIQDFALAVVRQHLALYIGGMGARGKNFYNELACRYGFEEASVKVQDLYLDGKKAEAADAVPEELARGITLIGSEAEVTARVKAFAAAGAGSLNAAPIAGNHTDRVRQVELLVQIASTV